MHAPDRSQPYAHPARLILILSLGPIIGLGIGRFAYALVLPDMRDSLGWSYSSAGFMNTIMPQAISPVRWSPQGWSGNSGWRRCCARERWPAWRRWRCPPYLGISSS